MVLGIALLAYGAVGGGVCGTTWLVLRSMSRKQALIDAEVRVRVEEVVTRVREREGPPEPLMSVGSQGHTLDIELTFVLPCGTGDIATEDWVRRGLAEGLAELPYALWLSVEFAHDPDLVAQGAFSPQFM